MDPLFDHIGVRSEQVATVAFAERVEEYLDNVYFKVGPGDPAVLTEVVVVGRVEAVSPGAGFSIEGADAPDGTQTDFGDPAALWKTVEISAVVEERLSGRWPNPIVRVGLAISGDYPFEQVQRNLPVGSRMLFLLRRSPVFEYNPELLADASDGLLLGMVDESGGLGFPALGDAEEGEFLSRVDSVDELRSSADAPPKLVVVDETGTRLSEEPAPGLVPD